jgi:Domain of unknown function (DUF929)
MGKASRAKTDINRSARIAAQRAAQRRREQQQRLLMAGGAILAVVAIVIGFVIWKANNSGNNVAGASNGPTGAALTSVVNDAVNVPASTLDSVGAGGSSLQGAIKKISGAPPLTSGGKPQVFFEGAEYCPYCAANRWGMVVALSRFGTFTGLKTVHSSTTDTPSNIPTFTFHGSTYTSTYIAFTGVETLTNIPTTAAPYYTTLDTPTAAQQALVAKYDAPPYTSSQNAGAIPFVDFGNQYIQSGDLPMLTPQALQGDWSKIAADLKTPSTANAKAVDGAANFMTAAICKLTNNQPSTACTSTIQGLESQL